MSIAKIKAIKSIINGMKLRNPEPAWIDVEQLSADEIVIQCQGIAFSWSQSQRIIDAVKDKLGLDCVKERVECVGRGYMVTLKVPFNHAWAKKRRKAVFKAFAGVLQSCNNIR